MDLIFVLYNSQKWIKKCFDSIFNCNYRKDKLNIIVVDNCSSDNSVDLLKEAKRKLDPVVQSFHIIESDYNMGFGKANNVAFSKGTSHIVCFLNIDTELLENTLDELEYNVNISEEKVAAWELRQFPYEHPKIYNPLTNEISWISGAAFAIRREIFEKVNGFDESIFMYAEDVDLSWRIRSFGYCLKYVPKAIIMHYSYSVAGEVKPMQYINSIINNLLLRYRFGGIETIIEGNLKVIKNILKPEVFKGARKMLIKAYLSHWKKIQGFRNKKYVGNSKDFSPCFVGFDYELIRDGAFYYNELPEKMPLVSIIVRTCQRPEVLRETLLSLKNQTYKNIEVVIVEDGPATSKDMVENEFGDLNILYFASSEKIGRSKAGNVAMNLAHGKYFNFLDDDDQFYADHVEVLVRALEKSSCRAAYAFAFETPIEVISKTPYVYDIKAYNCVYRQRFDKIVLCHHNYIPIQCIMFEKSLFLEYGGLDENVDALEDWDLWVRYSLHTDFECVEKTTSIYRVPFNRQISEKRQKELDKALDVMREKHKKYIQTLNVYDIAMLYQKQL